MLSVVYQTNLGPLWNVFFINFVLLNNLLSSNIQNEVMGDQPYDPLLVTS